MISFSYWEHKHFFNFWDFTVIGSGITGLTTAIFLKKLHPNANITILERGILPTGASTKNAGFACFGSVSEILDDLNTMSENEVFELLKARYSGLQLLRKLLTDKQSDYRPTGGYEIFGPEQNTLFEKCANQIQSLNKKLDPLIGKSVFQLADDKMDTFGFKNVNHLIFNPYEGIIDTGLMMKNLAEKARSLGVQILNGVTVKSIDSGSTTPVIDTTIGELKTGAVIVATNGFAQNLIPDLDIEPARAQVLITEPISGLRPIGCFHHDRGYNYFRSIDNRILLGGGRQMDTETENTETMETTGKLQNYLENILNTVILPQKSPKIEMRWSGIMGIGNSKKVILKKIGPSVLVAARFGGMGIALGSTIGKQAAEMISD